MDTKSATDFEIPIHNFRHVAGGIYRGARPSPEGLMALKQNNFKTVLSFRWRKGPIGAERRIATELGLTYINIPLNYWSLPNQGEIDRFLMLMDDESHHPIFVHCFHGADRTGLLIAIYRLVRCGWTFQQAYQEMLECGFHRFKTQHFKYALWRMAKKTIQK